MDCTNCMDVCTVSVSRGGYEGRRFAGALVGPPCYSCWYYIQYHMPTVAPKTPYDSTVYCRMMMTMVRRVTVQVVDWCVYCTVIVR